MTILLGQIFVIVLTSYKKFVNTIMTQCIAQKHWADTNK